MSPKQLSDILITFKSASKVPVGDAITQSSDPYLLAHLTPRVPPSKDHPPFPLTFRTSTKPTTRDPEWNEQWHLGGIPPEGFDLRIKIYDEDKPGDWDDRLGIAELAVNQLPSAGSAEGNGGEEKEYVLKIQKRKASKRAYALTYLVSWCHGDFKKQRGRVTITIQNLGKSTCTKNCPCVLGPMRWSIHTSPMIGRLAGTQAHPSDPIIPSEGESKTKQAFHKVDPISRKKKEKADRKARNQSFVFEANKIQLLGTIPADLRNKYVDYRPFIGWMFSAKGIRGWILNRGLRAQHRRVYCYDPSTKYGLVATPPAISKIEAGDVTTEGNVNKEEDNVNSGGKGKEKVDDTYPFAASRQFLEMVHWDEKPHPKVPGGRLYTYCITLQGEWRFTETGPEFTIDFLSKHSMHSDVSKEVACAGEFFVRRRRGKGGMKMNGQNHGGNEKDVKKGRSGSESEAEFEAPGYENKKSGREGKEGGHGESHAEKDHHTDQDDKSDDETQVSDKPAHNEGRSHDPRNFILIIDNDSGTYRPDGKQMPSLQKYLERNLPGLKVKAMVCDDEKLKKWKEEQKPKKEVLKARKMAQRSSDSSSISSSDEENVNLDV